MAKAIASVYRIDYEMSKSLWTVYIAGFTQEEALTKLHSTTSGINKITSIQYENRLDSISNQLADAISKPLRIKILELEDALKKAKKVPTSAKPSTNYKDAVIAEEETSNKINSKIRIDK